MKKLKSLLMTSMVFAILISFMAITTYAASNNGIYSSGVYLDNTPSTSQTGQVCLTGTSLSNKLKILIIKDGVKEWKEVKVTDGKFSEKLWLTSGEGTYTISIMIKKIGNVYSYGPKINIYTEKEISKYEVECKDIESEDKEIVELADRITKGKTTDIEKARSIYEWVSNNINYDYDKLNDQMSSDFTGNYGALNTLKTKKGVCYDYSTLTAALGRAAGLKVKVVLGYSDGNKEALHNWNEFYVSSQNTWIKADASSASTSKTDNFNIEKFFITNIKTSEF